MSVLRNVNLTKDEDIIIQDERFDELQSGTMRVASTEQLSAGTGDGIQITIENPSDSGVEMILFELVTFSTSGPLFPRAFINPDTGLPTTVRGVTDPNLQTDNTPQAVIKADTGETALSGGSDTGIEFGQNEGTDRRDIYVKIPEGDTLGFDVDPGGIAGTDVSFIFWFVEREV